LAPALTELISTYGVWLVAGVIALECICVPVPGETILVTAAIYAGTTHALNIGSVIGAAIAGGIAGNIIAFWIGRKFGYALLMRYGAYLRLSESRIRIGQYLFLQYGGKVVFFARFLPLLRSVAGVLAGINRMPWSRFLTANVAGAIAWVGVDCTAAYLFGEELTKLTGPIGIALAVIIVAILAAVAVIIAQHERRLACRARHALPGALQELPSSTPGAACSPQRTA
jgi:membrane protein DedA with SNARE-associated domain